jgi:radical SAM superfamily enzyme YgiQ (UPF0313 family)
VPRRLCKGCDRYSIPADAPKTCKACSIPCSIVIGKKLVAQQRAMYERSRAKQAKEEKQKHTKQRKEFKANDLPHQKELTRRVFNTMIRLLDRGKCCPTCDEPLIEGEYDAGHVRTVASCPQLRFDARACFGQCRKCNGSGTIRKRVKKTQEVVSDLYKAWILSEFGQAYYDWLYGPHELTHYACETLHIMRKEFAAEIKRLEQGLPPSRDWRALPEQQQVAV